MDEERREKRERSLFLDLGFILDELYAVDELQRDEIKITINPRRMGGDATSG